MLLYRIYWKRSSKPPVITIQVTLLLRISVWSNPKLLHRTRLDTIILNNYIININNYK